MTKKEFLKRIACISTGVVMTGAVYGLSGCSAYYDDGSARVARFALSRQHSYVLVQELNGVTLHKGSVYGMAAPDTGLKGVAPLVEVVLDCGLVLHTQNVTEYGTTMPNDSKYDFICECAEQN